MRRSYARGRLDEADLAGDWLSQFTRWFHDAVASRRLVEPNAMVVATATPDGRPSLRTVLLRGFDERGLVFYTNQRSRKGTELAANPAVALLFSWVPLERQVVVTGTASRVDRAETEAYFHGRPRASQLSAWASPQSSVIPSRETLDDAAAALARKWPEGTEVPVPGHWGGVRVVPETVEFWQGRPDRLHDRLRFRRSDASPDGGGSAGSAGAGAGGSAGAGGAETSAGAGGFDGPATDRSGDADGPETSAGAGGSGPGRSGSGGGSGPGDPVRAGWVVERLAP